MPLEAVGTTPAPVHPSSEPTEFPAEPRTVRIAPDEFAAGGLRTVRFRLVNFTDTETPGGGDVLHVRLAPGSPWITTLLPAETALGPGERQTVIVTVDTDAGRRAIRSGGSPSAPVRLLIQRLFGPDGRASGERESAVYIHLPVAICPACNRALETQPGGTAEKGGALPESCRLCGERIRPCPVCGAPNSWLARRCVQDSTHIIRSEPDWGMLGGRPGHAGSRETPSLAVTGLARRWSFPNVPPARRENALSWSAPVAAYGLVAAAAATAEGDAHIYAFDARTGAPLWEPYPLPDPVYPDRGGVALQGGRLFAATVDGVCIAVDAQRGTRLWETALPGRDIHVYGAVVPTVCDGVPVPLLLVAAAGGDGGVKSGSLFILNAGDGSIRQQIALSGLPDATPAADTEGRAFVHDDGGTLTAISLATGEVLWVIPDSRESPGGFDAAPVVHDGRVISADSTGMVVARDPATGEEQWRLTVTNAPFGGTPADDGLLIYLPADDGLHLISAEAGRAVRRYPTRLPVRSAPVVLDGALLFGCTDGNVYGAVGNGRGLEKLYETGTIGSQIVAAPAVADGAMFVTATNGVLYALSLIEGGSVGGGNREAGGNTIGGATRAS